MGFPRLSISLFLAALSFAFSGAGVASDLAFEEAAYKSLRFQKPQRGFFYYMSSATGGDALKEWAEEPILHVAEKPFVKKCLTVLPKSILSTQRLCHQYALSRFFGYEVMPEWIIKYNSPKCFSCSTYLTPVTDPQPGDLVVYYNQQEATHYGLVAEDGFIESTWGRGNDHVYRHLPFFVPELYGRQLAVWRPREGDSALAIRNRIETDLLNYTLRGMLSEEQQALRTLVTEVKQDYMRLDEVLGIACAFKEAGLQKSQKASLVLMDFIKQRPFRRSHIFVAKLLSLEPEVWPPLMEALTLMTGKVASHEVEIDWYTNMLKQMASYNEQQIRRIAWATHSLTQEAMGTRDVWHVLEEVSSYVRLKPDAFVHLMSGISLFVRPNMTGREVVLIIRWFDRCREASEINPYTLATLTKPFFVEGANLVGLYSILKQVIIFFENDQVDTLKEVVTKVNLRQHGFFLAEEMNQYLKPLKKEYKKQRGHL